MDGYKTRRVTVREAAILLGVSEGAVRKRVDRGTLEHDKGTDGRVYVYLPYEVPGGVYNGVDSSTTLESNPLISEMRSRIDFLEDELRRKDAILMNMTETMKALTAPTSPEPQESRETPSDLHPSVDPQRDDAGPETAKSGRSWWRRVFGE